MPLLVQPVVDKHQPAVQRRFVPGKQHHVVGVAVIIPHPGHLFKQVVEFRQVEISEVLGNIIADWHPRRAVDYAVKQPEHLRVLDFTTHHGFHLVVVYARVKLAHVQLQAVRRPLRVVPQVLAQLPQQRVHAAPLYAGVRVGGKLWRPYRLKHLHDRPVYHSVTEWQFIDFTAFALVFYKNIIGAGLVPLFCQFPVQLRQVLLQIGEKCRYLIALALAAGGVVRRLPQVVYVANARIQIAISFHFGSSGLSLGFGVCNARFGSCRSRHTRRPYRHPLHRLLSSAMRHGPAPLSRLFLFEPV